MKVHHFYDTQGKGLEWRSFEHLREQLEGASSFLSTYSVEDILKVLECFHNKIQKSASLFAEIPYLPFFATFCARSNMERVLQGCFENYLGLDNCVEGSVRVDRRYRIYPKGVVLNWVSGNIPTLAFATTIYVLLTKNVSILRLSARSDQRVVKRLYDLLFEAWLEVHGNEGIKSCFVFLSFDSDDHHTIRELSCISDARILWGGDEAIKNLRDLGDANCEDLYFGDRYSASLVPKGATSSERWQKFVSRFVSDVVLFDQSGCVSPHYLFLEDPDSLLNVDEILEDLSFEFQKQLSKNKLVAGSRAGIAQKVLAKRIRCLTQGGRWLGPADCRYTIFYETLNELPERIFGCNVFCTTVSNLHHVSEILDKKLQTLSLFAESSNDLIDKVAFDIGADRVTPVGSAKIFDIPWDGQLIPQKLVSIKSTYRT